MSPTLPALDQKKQRQSILLRHKDIDAKAPDLTDARTTNLYQRRQEMLQLHTGDKPELRSTCSDQSCDLVLHSTA